MSSNYPEGSMYGSGIYSKEVDYDMYTCDECGNTNTAGVAITDDYGDYTITCDHCGADYMYGSISEDIEADVSERMYDEWVESRLD